MPGSNTSDQPQRALRGLPASSAGAVLAVKCTTSCSVLPWIYQCKSACLRIFESVRCSSVYSAMSSSLCLSRMMLLAPAALQALCFSSVLRSLLRLPCPVHACSFLHSPGAPSKKAVDHRAHTQALEGQPLLGSPVGSPTATPRASGTAASIRSLSMVRSSSSPQPMVRASSMGHGGHGSGKGSSKGFQLLGGKSNKVGPSRSKG